MDEKELYDICVALAEGTPSAAATRRLHELLVVVCSYGLKKRQEGAFGNLFAQVDWLCKHCAMSTDDTQAVQTARRHSNRSEPIAADDWLYDLRAVALFVSAVSQTAVPGELLRRLPPTNRPRQKRPSINKDYIRCIVSRFDQSTIWADSDAGALVVDYGSDVIEGRDLHYIYKVLREGMQLNLLDCHLTDDHVAPLLIVAEPDFLVDISSLAACFTGYGHHPLLYTLSRLRPRTDSQATLLGNFAGTVLDETIAACGSSTTENELLSRSLRRSFREQALRFCACSDFDATKFRQQAQQQVRNIREAVEALFAQNGTDRALLEPSFICERLGLQGRVDLMTAPASLTGGHADTDLDTLLLVEQKSGKNMKIEHQSHDAHGVQLEAHYVQLLLYYGVLRYNFRLSDRQVDTRLLYSRYPAAQGLVHVNYYRTLFREAIRLRNQIVATELLVAREGFGRVLPLLTADVVYKGVPRDAFFHRFIEPEFALLAQRLSLLTPVERDYYERMMTFAYREQLCQKLGADELHAGGVSDLWQMPLSEKLETGNIFYRLKVTKCERSVADGVYDLITLSIPPQDDNYLPNFRRGDMVCLYSYDDEPDVRRSILFRGILQATTTQQLVVALTDGQQRADVFCTDDDRQWAVEHNGSDASASTAIRGLYQFVTADAPRRALLTGQRRPEADTSIGLSKTYNKYYDDVVLRQKQARDYFLLVGPPGTGKTSMALRFIVEEELATSTIEASVNGGPQPCVLLTAYTNRAVDEICGMLCEAGLPFLRVGNAAACDERYRSYLLESFLNSGRPTLEAIRQHIDSVSVVVGTTSMLQARPYILQLKQFSLCVVDEASQILEPSLVGLLCSPSIGRFVLVGDYKQLPAVVQQSDGQTAVSEPRLRAIGLDDCRRSLFERLIRWEQSQGREQFIGVLHRHGRMHPDVAAFPTARFYAAEQLLTVPLQHQQETTLGYDSVPSADALDELLKTRRVLFLPVKRQQDEGALAPDKSNAAEARVVADLLRRVHRFYGSHFSAEHTVGVIVPYRNQIAMVRQEIERLGIEALRHVTIDTVERYQGSQRDVIVYSFTIAHHYQLDFLTANTFVEDGQPIDRKLNVALTRARRQMLMVGNPRVLRQSALFAQLIDLYCEQQKQ